MAAQPNFSALGRALVAQGKLAQSEANAIQLEAVKAGVSFVQQLIASKKASAKARAEKGGRRRLRSLRPAG